VAIYLITGASSGIGREMSRLAVERGHTVYGLARRKDILDEMASELGERFLPFACDVSDKAAVHEVCENLPDLPQIAIMSAGLGAFGAKSEFDMESFERLFSVNFFGALHVIDALYKPFKKRGSGTFVGISSLSAYRALPGWPSYCASKAALTAALEGLAVSLPKENLRYVTVHPSFIATPMTAGQKGMFLVWEADRAAAHILDGIEAGKIDIVFPAVTRFLMWILRLAPSWLHRASINLFFKA